MQALVLAGGEGTRLRPLTYTTPKPVMPLAGRPFLSFMLDWLHGHGVDEVILSCGFLSDGVKRVLGDIYDGMRLRYVVEEEPLGTAGPVRLALDEGVLEERLLVLNGDVLTDIDLTAELDQHERTGARATLALYAVEDTASYGVVPTDAEGRVEAFLEKAEGAAPTNRINAGAYVLEREVIESIPAGRAGLVRARGLPAAGRRRASTASLAEGYWIDIGTPERYLEATWDLLAGRVQSTLPPRDETGSLVDEGCLRSGAHIGPQSVLGRHCSVGSDSRVERSVLHDRVHRRRRRRGARERARPRACAWASARASSRARWSGAGAVIGDGRGGRQPALRLESGRRRAAEPVRALEAGDDRGVDPAGCSTTSWPSRTSSATRSGAPSRPASRRPDRPGGLVVCGMGGSAIGGDLARRRSATAPRARSGRCAATRSSPGRRRTASSLCASYSGNTEETLACFEAAGAAGARPRGRSPPAAGWPRRARAEGVPGDRRARRACSRARRSST